ncbi:transporter [Halegenticoccus tardaugens]|nr:transporter [Halegenticoccus tardaugens]
MVRLSTGVILVGIVLLFVPVPPVATILGILVVLLGLALRFLRGS